MDSKENLFQFKDTEILGTTSKSTAVVTNVQQIDLNGNVIVKKRTWSTLRRWRFRYSPNKRIREMFLFKI